jgi:Transglycosylase SLT domain
MTPVTRGVNSVAIALQQSPMNRHDLSSDASLRSSDRLAQHLGEAASRRSRRRTLTRCSAVVAALLLGTSQCDASEPTTTAPTTAPATAPTTAPTTAPATTTTSAAERVVVAGPEGTEVAGRCTQYEHLLTAHAPSIGWDVLRMSRLAWRESNCWANVRSSTSDSGLLQINDVTLSFLNESLGEPVDPVTLMDPVQNVRAAAALCTFWARNGSSCYQPWSAG